MCDPAGCIVDEKQLIVSVVQINHCPFAPTATSKRLTNNPKVKIFFFMIYKI
jgi:hypothetical protein